MVHPAAYGSAAVLLKRPADATLLAGVLLCSLQLSACVRLIYQTYFSCSRVTQG